MREVEVKTALLAVLDREGQAHTWEKLKVGKLESKARFKTFTVERGLPLLEDTVKKFCLADLVVDRASLFEEFEGYRAASAFFNN